METAIVSIVDGSNSVRLRHGLNVVMESFAKVCNATIVHSCSTT